MILHFFKISLFYFKYMSIK